MWEDTLHKLRQKVFQHQTDAGRFKHRMDDPAQDEINRQNFSRLYGLSFEQLGKCHARVEDTEQYLYRLKDSLVPEQAEEPRR
eukprot:8811587-Heterocapsa_arctica.AAC.1